MTRWAVLAGMAAAGAASLTPAPAAADEPVRPEAHDPGIYPPPGSGVGLMLAGLGTTAFWYGGAVSFSYLWPDAPGADDLRIPVAGPWMALADTGCAETNPDCGLFGVILRAVLTTIDAVGQTGGVAVMVEGAFLPTSEGRPAKKRRLPPPRLQRAPEADVSAVPFVSGDAVGVGFVGRF